jgi:hypothetical protein
MNWVKINTHVRSGTNYIHTKVKGEGDDGEILQHSRVWIDGYDSSISTHDI